MAAGALVLGVAAVRTVGSMAFGLLVAPPALHVGAKTLNGLAFGRALGSTKGALGSGAPACAERAPRLPTTDDPTDMGPRGCWAGKRRATS